METLQADEKVAAEVAKTNFEAQPAVTTSAEDFSKSPVSFGERKTPTPVRAGSGASE